MSTENDLINNITCQLNTNLDNISSVKNDLSLLMIAFSLYKASVRVVGLFPLISYSAYSMVSPIQFNHRSKSKHFYFYFEFNHCFESVVIKTENQMILN